MRIFAHRGYSGKFPENSMPAFEKAGESGCYGIELDVQLTRDGQVVIFHDEALHRVTEKPGFLKDYLYAELPRIQEGNLHIPTLAEYLNWARDKDLVTNIEIKSSIFFYPGLEEKVSELVNRYQLDEKVLISSFNPLSLLIMKECAPHIPRAFLVERYGSVGFEFLCERFSFSAFHPDISIVSGDLVARAKEKGISVHTYTVDTEKQLKQAFGAGVDGIFTNYPEEMELALRSFS